MGQDDPEKHIAELERQLAEAKAAARHTRAGTQPPHFSDAHAVAVRDGDERARRHSKAVWEGLRSGGGPAGLSTARLGDTLNHGAATIRMGHSVVYAGQRAASGYGAMAGFGAGTEPWPGFPEQVGPKHQATYDRPRPRGKRKWINRVGVTVGVIGICAGAAASVTATMPASALWTSPFVCDSGYQLAYNTSNYSYKPDQSGTSVSFECTGDTGSYVANWIAIDAVQTLLFAPVLGAAVLVGLMIWRRFRSRADL